MGLEMTDHHGTVPSNPLSHRPFTLHSVTDIAQIDPTRH